MAKDNAQLADRLSTQGASTAPVQVLAGIREWHKKNEGALATLLGSKQNAEKLYLAAVHSISRNPYLLSCDKSSLCQCMMQSAHLDLYPGPLQECAYVPFKGKATFIPQYQGLVKLALQSGIIGNIRAVVVFERDEFDYNEGTEAYIRHRRYPGEDPGAPIAAYCTWRSGEQTDFELMFKREIDSIMSRSAAVKQGRSTPWDTDWEEMAKKTVIKRASKKWPKSIKLAQAIEVDNAVERPDLEQKPVIDISSLVVEESEGVGAAEGESPSL